MIFCRVENPQESIVIGEGDNVDMAFENANRNAPYEFGPECSITFWKATEMDITVSFEPTFKGKDY